MYICLRCDATNPDGANFCLRCGASLLNQRPGASTAPLPPASQATYPQQNPQQQVWVAPPPTQGPVQQYPPAQVQGPVQQAPYQQYTLPPAQVNVVMQQSAAPRFYQPVPVMRDHKSVFLAFILTMFFVPFGMFYSTVGGAIVMIFVTIGLAVVTSGIGLILTQIVCVIWGMLAADSYNKRA